MNILPLLIGLSTLFLIAGAVALFWAVDHDQFEDMETPRMLPLADARSQHPEPPPPADEHPS